MKNLFRQAGALFLTLTFAAAVFAAPAEKKQTLKAGTDQMATAMADGYVPSSVLDRNFRAWQPSQQVPMYASFARNDIAWTDGRVIYYNPQIAASVPAKVAAFFLAHEYGHIFWRTSSEVAADQFAGQAYSQTDMGVVYAAIWHMANIQPYATDGAHPIGLQRAQIIGQAAGLSPVQIDAAMRGAF